MFLQTERCFKNCKFLLCVSSSISSALWFCTGPKAMLSYLRAQLRKAEVQAVEDDHRGSAASGQVHPPGDLTDGEGPPGGTQRGHHQDHQVGAAEAGWPREPRSRMIAAESLWEGGRPGPLLSSSPREPRTFSAQCLSPRIFARVTKCNVSKPAPRTVNHFLNVLYFSLLIAELRFQASGSRPS